MKKFKPVTLPHVMHLPGHFGPAKQNIVMIATTVHTVTLGNGRSYTALVLDRSATKLGAVTIMTGEEVEHIISLLRLASEDADRLNGGLAPINTVKARIIQ